MVNIPRVKLGGISPLVMGHFSVWQVVAFCSAKVAWVDVVNGSSICFVVATDVAVSCRPDGFMPNGTHF